MNKRGIFLPFLVVLSIVLLGVLTFTIEESNVYKKTQGRIGSDAQSLFAMYDEAISFEIYMQEAFPFAQQKAYQNLKDQGGYAQELDCETRAKSLAEDKTYTYLNSCTQFDPEGEYVKQLAIEVEKYAKNYQSIYPDPKETCDGVSKGEVQAITKNAYRPLSEAFNELYKQAEVTAAINEITIEIRLHPKGCGYVLKTEDEATYTFTIKLPFEKPSFNVFNEIYETAKACTSLSECQTEFREKGAETAIVSDTLFIKYQEVSIALTDGEVPPRSKSSLFV